MFENNQMGMRVGGPDSGVLAAQRLRFESNSVAGMYIANTTYLKVSDSTFTQNAVGIQCPTLGCTSAAAGNASPFGFIARSDFVANTQGGATVSIVGGGGPGPFPISQCRFVANQGHGLEIGSDDFSIISTSDDLFARNQLGVLLTGPKQSPSVIANSVFLENTHDGPCAAVQAFGIAAALVNDSFIRNHASSGADICSSASLLDVPASSVTLCSFLDSTSDDGHDITGPSVTITDSALWPGVPPGDAPSKVQYSCFAAASGATNRALGASPFDARDLDGDGVPELNLSPSSACVDHGSDAAATATKVPFATFTTNPSGCLDVSPVDIGRHYASLASTPGACP